MTKKEKRGGEMRSKFAFLLIKQRCFPNQRNFPISGSCATSTFTPPPPPGSPEPQLRDALPAGAAPQGPHAPQQLRPAPEGHGGRAAAHRVRPAAPAAAQPGPEPGGEERADPQAGPGHRRPGGEDQEDAGIDRLSRDWSAGEVTTVHRCRGKRLLFIIRP